MFETEEDYKKKYCPAIDNKCLVSTCAWWVWFEKVSGCFEDSLVKKGCCGRIKR